MLERLFTSNTRVKLLRLLLFNQDKEYYLRQISKVIGVSPIYTSSELKNLEELNIVKRYKKANLMMYQVNKECVLLMGLRELFLKTDLVGEEIRKKVGDKAKYCFIYGSFAKGTESEHSDIDLFVIGQISEDELVSIVQKAEKKISREINYVLWNEKTFLERTKKHHLLQTIKKSPIIMLVGDEDEFRKSI